MEAERTPTDAHNQVKSGDKSDSPTERNRRFSLFGRSPKAVNKEQAADAISRPDETTYTSPNITRSEASLDIASGSRQQPATISPSIPPSTAVASPSTAKAVPGDSSQQSVPAPHSVQEQVTSKLSSFLTGPKLIFLVGVSGYTLGSLGLPHALAMLAIFALAWAWRNYLEKHYIAHHLDIEKHTALAVISEQKTETVEWVNSIMAKLWRILDRELFVAVTDLLEEAMQRFMPPIFVERVKVTEFDLGVISPRLTSIKILAPEEGENDDFVRGEATFSFYVKKDGIHLEPPYIMIDLITSLKKVIPVKAELVHCVGKARFKIETKSNPPFLGKAEIALLGLPQLEMAIRPLTDTMNLMQLPLIKQFIASCVNAVLLDLTDPKSIILDVESFMTGDEVVHETRSIGIIRLEAFEALNLPKADILSDNDPYIELKLSESSKQRAAYTRVLLNSSHPVWNEVLYLPITGSDVTNGKSLEINLWDSDRGSSDDLLGKVLWPIKKIVMEENGEMVKEERLLHDGWSEILQVYGKGKGDGNAPRGQVRYRLSYHPKIVAPPAKKLVPADDGISRGILAAVKEQERELERDEARAVLVERERPEKCKQIAGIMLVQLHQAADLEIMSSCYNDRSHPYDPESVPNPYADIYVNDRQVARTRIKMHNPAPYWNLITENFIPDLHHGSVRVILRDQKTFEHDPLLGLVLVRAHDFFCGREQEGIYEVTRWFMLTRGVAYGHIRLSLIFRPIKISIPRQLKGYDVGTLVVSDVMAEGIVSPLLERLERTQLHLSLNMVPVSATHAEGYGQLIPDEIEDRVKTGSFGLGITEGRLVWEERRFELPVLRRYQTALVVRLVQKSSMKLKTTSALGKYWLKHLPSDGVEHEVVIGLNSVAGDEDIDSQVNAKDELADQSGPLGKVRLKLCFIPGLSLSHSDLRGYRLDATALESEQESTGDKQKKRASVASSVYSEWSSASLAEGDDDDTSSGVNTGTSNEARNRVHRNKLARKLQWSKDKIKSKVGDLMREHGQQLKQPRLKKL
ncbi:uncharacterized protein VTP21DRAFT_9809 [Calcarisporiella thermophila]|uniref:uncharacterized protein n=1 Tax=Calcarisporiella thermophila TaxID=911321 RepID=UPI0037426B6F